MASTLKDVAERTGLSVSTVSNILSGNDPRYNDKTRDLVRRAAEELDYHPHRAARVIQGRKSGVIGVLVPDLSYSYFPDIVHAIELEADAAGYQVLLCQTHYDEEDEAQRVSLLRQHRVDGLVLFPIPFSERNKDVFLKLRRSNIPVVCVDAEVEGVRFDFVGTDDYRGACTAVSHLIGLGHRRIVCLAFGDDSPIREARRRGYVDAHKQAGLSVEDDMLVSGPWELDAPGNGLFAAFTGTNKPTALFAMSDHLAVWAYFTLRDGGLRVPQDVSLIGFGGLREGRLLDTPLTTVTQDTETMGRTAVKLLLKRMDKPQRRRRRVLLDPELTVKASCGALKNVPPPRYPLPAEGQAGSFGAHSPVPRTRR